MTTLDLSRWQFGITTVYLRRLLLAGLAVPLLAARAARGELAAALTDIVSGAADLHAYGANPAITGRVHTLAGIAPAPPSRRQTAAPAGA